MTRTLLALLLLTSVAVPAAAQSQVRFAVGAGSAGLGDAGAAFGNLVDGLAQVAPGLAAQRAYPVWWIAEAEARAPAGPVAVGGRLQARWTQADALYGDYAGTVDVLGRTRALLAEAEVSVPLGSWPLRAAAHGGAIGMETRLTADAVAELDGQSEGVRYRLTGTGIGPTVGASLVLDVPLRSTVLSARLGARWGRVSSLRASESTATSQTEGELNLAHGFSGVSLTVGVGL